VIVTGKDFIPEGLFAGTLAMKVKVDPEPLNDWFADPPINDKSALTPIPELSGF